MKTVYISFELIGKNIAKEINLNENPFLLYIL